MNRLADETSPYLRQHADNPVDWYPWGDEAFEAARRADKPILLSVGYSACHWCHVMAHESFEDADTAAIMNELVVSVKVDREERPDVDAIYMEAVQAMTGQGGWPMTVFLMPDGRPFFGGTYFPKAARGNMLSFTDLLRRIDDVWRTRRDDLVSQADDLTESIARGSQLPTREDIPGPDVLDGTYASLAAQFDPAWGGFGQAPKFPQTMSLEFLLRAHAHNRSPETLAMVTTSLDAMASGGIYDHVGGAFARYSVDERWLVPHFEKMLYDQALLARVYLHAWQVTGEARYRQVLDETIEYVARDLRHRGGGFYSAEDADSLDPEGHAEEGRFYTWTLAELDEILGPLADVAAAWWGVTEGGNFEGRTILHRPVRGDLVRPPDVERARRELFDEREGRPRPGLDDKVLTEWNGLM
ncbi:MAG: thioredoxin domain-containing protein, partial [Acidimicrobiales bacterium]